MPQLSVLPSKLPRRWLFFALAGAAVLALHWALLVMLAPSWIDPEEPTTAPPVLSVRSVAMPAPAPPAAVQAALPPRVAPPAPKIARAPTPRKPAASAPPVQEPPRPPPLETVAAVEPPAPVATPSEPSPVPAIEVPVYATRLPPAGSWRYQLTRGIASGEAQLSWQPSEQQRYEMRLEGAVAGINVLDWVSAGVIDSAGIAPDRFVIRRRGKDNQAANFQRDAGKITFSGPTHELPLIAGVQDRLTWMLQLAGVVEAAPQSFGAGASVVLMVVGARGGADVWTFKIVGPDRVGELAALKLVREARKPRDLQVDIWLDPARGHIPLRALLAQPEGGSPLELNLLTGSTGP